MDNKTPAYHYYIYTCSYDTVCYCSRGNLGCSSGIGDSSVYSGGARYFFFFSFREKNGFSAKNIILGQNTKFGSQHSFSVSQKFGGIPRSQTQMFRSHMLQSPSTIKWVPALHSSCFASFDFNEESRFSWWCHRVVVLLETKASRVENGGTPWREF